MLRIYYSNFALSTWCVRVSLRLCDAIYALLARPRSQPVDSRERLIPATLRAVIFRRRYRRDIVARFVTETAARVTGLHVARKSHDHAKYAGVRRRFGST